MRIEFRDRRLALVQTEQAADTKLPVSVIKSLRDKLVLLGSAPDERTLRNWRSLHYEKLKGEREGQRSIRINAQWRLVFELDTTQRPPTIVVLSVEDYHRG